MVSIMNNLPIDTKPALDPSSFPVVETLEATESPAPSIEELRFHGDLRMGSDGIRISSELDVSLGQNSGYVTGEINREVDQVLTNTEDRTVSCSQSSCSVNDSSFQKQASGSMELVQNASGFEFQTGDMVWGKVKSHPWWPGHLFNEAFASAAVRRSRRVGHHLVAFFGDSSYGWFDPAELIPFEPHYAEKSRQTSSRNFMKAVEEAVDEASRRRALGLVCCCRSPNNFRPTTVPGYFAVDVAGYDLWGVHSAKQIEEARDSFRPVEMLSFVHRLALIPRESEQRSIDWIKMTATVLAYRRAVFEEFDETYAQAFGVEVVRPSRDSSGQLEQHPMRVPRAPLSGPLVIAEALGDRVARSTKPVKAKDSSKRYLFKRRDEPFVHRPISKQKQEVHAAVQSKADTSSPAPSIRDYGNSTGPSSDFFLKRTPTLEDKNSIQLVNQEQHGIKGHEEKVQIREETGQFTGSGSRELVEAKVGLVESNLIQTGVDMLARLPNVNVGAFSTGETSFMLRSEDATGSMAGVLEKSEVCIDSGLNAGGQVVTETLRGDDANMANLQYSKMVNISDVCKPSLVDVPTNVVVESGEHRWANLSGDVHGITKVDDGLIIPVVADKMKAKASKQPWEDSGSENSVVEERKKKRKKKESDPSLDRPPKHQKFEKNGELMMLDGELVKVNGESKDDGFVGSTLVDAVVKVELPQLPELVSDLLALALDPFHGFKRNCPATVRQAFLRFRSLVYQKSLILPAAGELDAVELGSSRFNSGRMQLETGAGIPTSGGTDEGDKTDIVNKKLKPGIREKLSRKRSHSDQQDEISEKRQKKLNALKSIGLAKKSGQKLQPESIMKGLLEVRRGERKEMGMAAVQAKSVQLDSGRRPEPTVKAAAQPAMLIMKFPIGTALPSISQLKAMFIRFGPLDHLRTRVFFNSDTCKVLFKHKADAKAAYDYASRNNLFGQTRVIYYLKEFPVELPEPLESSRRGVDEGTGELSNEARPGQQYQQRSAVQLKSCLKKPVSDVVGIGSTGVVKESPRVKFLLGGEESNRGEQLLSSSSNDGAPPPPSFGLDVNKNVKMVLPPLLPLTNTYHSSAVHETPANFSTTDTQANFSEAATKRSVDISHQLMRLLMRMNDIVSDVKGTLGYVPYHPL